MREFADVINEAIADIDSSIRIISEPGRYFVTSAVKAVACVHGKKKTIGEDGLDRRSYYVNDGIYGSFFDEALKIQSRLPKLLKEKNQTKWNHMEEKEEDLHLSTLWGPTCDSFDCIAKDVYLPNYKVGDWLYWDDMGAYTSCLACNFNGYPLPTMFPVMRRSSWESFCSELNRKNTKEIILSEIHDN